ncbi:MAG: hypothetical protein MJE66_06865 [Proteobacteria bacterium]|nr:hypothetical protein [Pseudomonadota bacterium]
MTRPRNDDPRKLRELLIRGSELARSHRLSSVVVGMAAQEGDLLFPEFVDFLESALRVEDGIFRMMRERAVVLLADVTEADAEEVAGRLVQDFCDEYPSLDAPRFEFRFFEVQPEKDELRVKEVLPALFHSDLCEPTH